MAAGDQSITTQRAVQLATNGTVERLVGCNGDGMLFTHPWSNFGITQDLLANDSDKTFTVPAAHLWIVHWVMVQISTTATSGSRALALEIADASGNVLARTGGAAGIVASVVDTVLFGGAIRDRNYVGSDSQDSPLPANFILPAAFTLRVFDFAAIDAAADDMEVTIGRQEIDDT